MASVIDLEPDEIESYPILNEEGKFYTEKLDVKNAMEFGQYEFLQACQSMGIVGNSLQDTKQTAEA